MPRHFQTDLEESCGLWQYESGGKYLVQLPDGKVSDTFIDTAAISCNPVLLWHSVQMMYDSLTTLMYIDNKVPPEPQMHNTFTVGSSPGGESIAYEMSRRVAGVATYSESQDGKQVYSKFILPKNCRLLFLQEHLDDSSVAHGMISAVGKQCYENYFINNPNTGPEVIPYLLCLVDSRQYKKDIEITVGEAIWRFRVVALLDVNKRIWDSRDEALMACECAKDALDPLPNWSRLTGR